MGAWWRGEGWGRLGVRVTLFITDREESTPSGGVRLSHAPDQPWRWAIALLCAWCMEARHDSASKRLISACRCTEPAAREMMPLTLNETSTMRYAASCTVTLQSTTAPLPPLGQGCAHGVWCYDTATFVHRRLEGYSPDFSPGRWLASLGEQRARSPLGQGCAHELVRIDWAMVVH